MGREREGLVLLPSRKHAGWRRWQDPSHKNIVSTEEFEKWLTGGEIRSAPLEKTPLPGMPYVGGLIKQPSRHREHQEHVNGHLRALFVGRDDPVVKRYEAARKMPFSPISYTDFNGNSLLVLSKDPEIDMPHLVTHMREVYYPEVKRQDVGGLIAAHEYTHAWDNGLSVPEQKRSASDHILREGIGLIGGRPPKLEKNTLELHPRLWYAQTPIEFPAVMTELAMASPSTLDKLGQGQLPWVYSYLDMLWGADFGGEEL